jgi:outer membrane protein assembly factor BamB
MKRCLPIALTVVLYLCSTCMAQDWPRFAGPGGDLKAEQSPPLSRDWGEDGPPIAWVLRHEGVSAAGPAIREGKAYLAERITGKDVDILKCVRLSDGDPVWTFRHHSPADLHWEMARGTPWVGEEKLWFTGNAGDLYCLDRADGKLLWHKRIWEMFDARWFDMSTTHETKKGIGWSSSAIVEGDLVIVAPQGKKATLAAFDKNTGELVWTTPALGDGSHSSPAVFDLAGTRQIIMPLNDLCIGVDPKTGQVLWRIELDCKIRFCASAAVIAGDRVVLVLEGFAPFVLKVRATSGGEYEVEQIHEFDYHCGGDFRPIETDDSLYMLCQHGYKSKPGLYCVSKETFEKRWWERPTPPIGWGPHLMADGMLLILSQHGTLFAIEPSPEGYRELSKAQVIPDARGWNSAVWAHAGISDGRYIGRAKGVTVCVDLRKKPQ